MQILKKFQKFSSCKSFFTNVNREIYFMGSLLQISRIRRQKGKIKTSYSKFCRKIFYKFQNNIKCSTLTLNANNFTISLVFLFLDGPLCPWMCLTPFVISIQCLIFFWASNHNHWYKFARHEATIETDWFECLSFVCSCKISHFYMLQYWHW